MVIDSYISIPLTAAVWEGHLFLWLPSSIVIVAQIAFCWLHGETKAFLAAHFAFQTVVPLRAGYVTVYRRYRVGTGIL